ncbi:hypothetical protein DFH07DRAFT_309430 [Mycena maculata]|uniref:F-box domain-containing protein n=1 Tax=Mycena maculata TaxID=230809 RepID=A0AAD7HG82_9AGAR|nr:hypothetical protein DFH07DRAFT_309430 [Mycena maculata]
MAEVVPELVDLIFSFLHTLPLKYGSGEANFLVKSVASTLGKCALVCKAWVPSSRRILFYRVHVGQNNTDAFGELLGRPQLLTFLPFIREIELADGDWTNTELPKILARLPPSIHTLMLILAPRMIMQSAPCCPSLSLVTRLEIVDRWGLALSDVVQCIASFPTLVTLKLRSRGWSSTALPEPTLDPPKTWRGLHLRTPDPNAFLSWMQRASVDISTLRIYVPPPTLYPASFQSVVQYIERLGPLLKALDLILDHWNPKNEYGSLSSDFLRPNTRLQSLSIEALPAQVRSLLLSFYPIPSLESITVAVAEVDTEALHILPWLDTPPLRSSFPSWPELDRVLVPFISVRHLGITYFGDYSPHDAALFRLRVGEISAHIREVLPLYAARGVVTQDVLAEKRFLYE